MEAPPTWGPAKVHSCIQRRELKKEGGGDVFPVFCGVTETKVYFLIFLSFGIPKSHPA